MATLSLPDPDEARREEEDASAAPEAEQEASAAPEEEVSAAEKESAAPEAEAVGQVEEAVRRGEERKKKPARGSARVASCGACGSVSRLRDLDPEVAKRARAAARGTGRSLGFLREPPRR